MSGERADAILRLAGVSGNLPSDNDVYVRLIQPMMRPRTIAVVIGFTIMLRMLAALGGNLFLLSIGISFPFLASMLFTSLIFIVFSLPISVGTLGVREAAYILLLGMFGVDKEAALTVSFLALLCLVSNNLLGGVWMLLAPAAAGRNTLRPGTMQATHSRRI